MKKTTSGPVSDSDVRDLRIKRQETTTDLAVQGISSLLQGAVTLATIYVVLLVILTVLTLGTGAFVACHFIAKFW